MMMMMMMMIQVMMMNCLCKIVGWRNVFSRISDQRFLPSQIFFTPRRGHKPGLKICSSDSHYTTVEYLRFNSNLFNSTVTTRNSLFESVKGRFKIFQTIFKGLFMSNSLVITRAAIKKYKVDRSVFRTCLTSKMGCFVKIVNSL